jgi:hypothetical protein
VRISNFQTIAKRPGTKELYNTKHPNIEIYILDMNAVEHQAKHCTL